MISQVILFTKTIWLFLCFSVSSCALGFLLGLLFTQRSGNYFVTMFDDYSATLPLVIVVVFETISVAWVYGTDRYETNTSDSFYYSAILSHLDCFPSLQLPG